MTYWVDIHLTEHTIHKYIGCAIIKYDWNKNKQGNVLTILSPINDKIFKVYNSALGTTWWPYGWDLPKGYWQLSLDSLANLEIKEWLNE